MTYSQLNIYIKTKIKIKITYKKMNRDPNSIADWFDRHGMDGSYGARERLFRDCGWSNYRGTASQNTAMLNYLKSEFGD